MPTFDFVNSFSLVVSIGLISILHLHVETLTLLHFFPWFSRLQTHGVLNAVSWGILMPIGAIMARYMKVFADPAWFYLHVACQLSAYIVGVAGWGTGLKLGSDSPGITYHRHRNIGIALFCLATLQVYFTFKLKPYFQRRLT